MSVAPPNADGRIPLWPALYGCGPSQVVAAVLVPSYLFAAAIAKCRLSCTHLSPAQARQYQKRIKRFLNGAEVHATCAIPLIGPYLALLYYKHFP